MNIIDLILSIFLLLGIIRGIFKGFVAELAGLVALIVGVYAAIHYSEPIYSLLTVFFSWEEKVLAIIAFALTFFLVALLISLLGRIISKMLSLLALGLVNRLLGGIFGMLKMAFLASLFLMFLESFELFQADKETREKSILYEPVHEFAPTFLPAIIKEVKEGDLFIPPSEEDEKEAN